MSPLPSWEERDARVLSSYAPGTMGGRLRAPGPRPVPRAASQQPTGRPGGGFAVLVAASDATSAEKQLARYICSGTNDEVVINRAIDEAAASGNGGAVLLSSGFFHTADTITLHGFVVLSGVGFTASFIGYDGLGAAVVLNDHFCGVSDLELFCNAATIQGTGIRCTHFNGRVERCSLWTFAVGVDIVGHSGHWNEVLNCQFGQCLLGLHLHDQSQTVAIVGNQFVNCKNGLLVEEFCSHATVTGNVLLGNDGVEGGGGTYGYGVKVGSGGDFYVVSGNSIGFHMPCLDLAAPTTAVGNALFGVGEDGASAASGDPVVHLSSSQIVCNDNKIFSGNGNTDAVLIDNSAHGVSFQGNWVKGPSLTTGVHVTGAADDVVVINNILPLVTNPTLVDGGATAHFNLDGSANNWNLVSA